MPPTDAPPADDGVLEALARRLGRALLAADLRLAVAESCTGGWIAKVLTDIPGASDWFDAAFVTYTDEAKVSMLGVAPGVLAEHGAVSEPVVREMTAGARRVTGAGAALAVSGIAGPAGGSAHKPVGLVHFAWSVGDRDWARRVELEGDRDAVRRQSVALALGVLADALRGETA